MTNIPSFVRYSWLNNYLIQNRCKLDEIQGNTHTWINIEKKEKFALLNVPNNGEINFSTAKSAIELLYLSVEDFIQELSKESEQ